MQILISFASLSYSSRVSILDKCLELTTSGSTNVCYSPATVRCKPGLDGLIARSIMYWSRLGPITRRLNLQTLILVVVSILARLSISIIIRVTIHCESSLIAWVRVTSWAGRPALIRLDLTPRCYLDFNPRNCGFWRIKSDPYGLDSHLT
jgi:hypothetical protein